MRMVTFGRRNRKVLIAQADCIKLSKSIQAARQWCDPVNAGELMKSAHSIMEQALRSALGVLRGKDSLSISQMLRQVHQTSRITSSLYQSLLDGTKERNEYVHERQKVPTFEKAHQFYMSACLLVHALAPQDSDLYWDSYPRPTLKQIVFTRGSSAPQLTLVEYSSYELGCSIMYPTEADVQEDDGSVTFYYLNCYISIGIEGLPVGFDPTTFMEALVQKWDVNNLEVISTDRDFVIGNRLLGLRGEYRYDELDGSPTSCIYIVGYLPPRDYLFTLDITGPPRECSNLEGVFGFIVDHLQLSRPRSYYSKEDAIRWLFTLLSEDITVGNSPAVYICDETNPNIPYLPGRSDSKLYPSVIWTEPNSSRVIGAAELLHAASLTDSKLLRLKAIAESVSDFRVYVPQQAQDVSRFLDASQCSLFLFDYKPRMLQFILTQLWQRQKM